MRKFCGISIDTGYDRRLQQMVAESQNADETYIYDSRQRASAYKYEYCKNLGKWKTGHMVHLGRKVESRFGLDIRSNSV